MTLIGRNEDSSGFYEIHQEGAALITYTGSSPDDLQELGVQQLRHVDAGSVEQGDEHWYEYGTNGHHCGIYEGDGFARIDGITYKLHSHARMMEQICPCLACTAPAVTVAANSVKMAHLAVPVLRGRGCRLAPKLTRARS